MEDSSPAPAPKHSDRVLARGAYTSLLGMGGKLLLPASFVVITRLFGPDVMGVFLLVFMLLDMVANLTVSGINDGVVMLATRSDEEGVAGQRTVYHVLANGFATSLGIAALVIAVSYVGGPSLLREFYPSPFDLVGLVQIMVLALPFRAITIIVIASTKVHMTMKWDALLDGFGRSGLLLAASIVAYVIDPSLASLGWAYVAAWTTIGLVSLFAFRRYYRYGALFREFARFRVSGPLLRFALPQNLNMAFSNFATNLDVIMLAYFHVAPAQLGFYGMAAQIVRNVRQVKLIFSGAYAPVIVRLHTQGDHEAMNRTYSMVSRWAITIALPLALVIVFFRSYLIQIFDSSFDDDTTFMLILLFPPLLSVGLGLASNMVVMTGHSGWNLFNSLLAAATNIALNYVLIPHYGLVGAAAATAISAVIVTAITQVEAKVLVGASLVLQQVYKPLLAGLVASVVPLTTAWLMPNGGWIVQTVGCAVALAIYFAVVRALGVASEDLEALAPWRRRAPAPP